MIPTNLERSAERKARRLSKAKRIGSKKPSLSKLKKILWTHLSLAVRLYHPPRCYTCPGPSIQCGHMMPKGRAHALSAWHPGNLRPQCIYCNLHMGGNGAEFSQRYIQTHGQEEFDRIRRLSKTPHKWTVPEIEMLIAKIKLGLDHYTAFYEATYCEGI